MPFPGNLSTPSAVQPDMWILQTDTDTLTGDLELIAAHLLEKLQPPLTPRQVELLAEIVTGAPGRITRI